MAQIELENQPEMVHPARMGPPSCWMDQKAGQNLPRLGDYLLENASWSRTETGRVREMGE